MDRHHWAPAPREALVTQRRDDGVTVTAMQPIANPTHRRRVHHVRQVAPVRSARPAPHHAPAPVRPAPAAKVAPRPVAIAPTPAPTPALKPAPLATAVPSPRLAPDPLAQLSTALAADIKAAKLDVPTADLAAGKAGKVTLTLPATLLASIQREAAKLGLTKAARKASVSATLTGQGYVLTPKGAQKTRLRAGEAASLSWQVAPSVAGRAPLRAEVSGALTGSGGPKSFSLGALVAQIAPPVTAAPETAPTPAKFRLVLPNLGAFSLKALAIPGYERVQIPGIGRVRSEKVVLAGLLALIGLLLLGIGRSASARKSRAARRRRFRTFESAQPTEHEA